MERGIAARGLMSHLAGGNIRFAQTLRGEPADWPTRDAELLAIATRHTATDGPR